MAGRVGLTTMLFLEHVTAEPLQAFCPRAVSDVRDQARLTPFCSGFVMWSILSPDCCAFARMSASVNPAPSHGVSYPRQLPSRCPHVPSLVKAGITLRHRRVSAAGGDS